MSMRIRYTPRHLVGILGVRDGGRWLTACGLWADGADCTPVAITTTCADCQRTGAYRAQVARP